MDGIPKAQHHDSSASAAQTLTEALRWSECRLEPKAPQRLPESPSVPQQSPTRRVQTVFLDAGGVLIHPNWQRVSDTCARHGIHVTADALRSAEPEVKFAIDTAERVKSTVDADRGSALFHGVLDRAGAPRGSARDAALAELYAYHTAHNLWEDVDPAAATTLDRLRALGVTLAVVSNANGVVHRAFERAGLHSYFGAICDSHVEGVEKPDPRFFEIVLDRTGSRPETTVHVGDLYHVDVVGARRAGVYAVLLDPHRLYEGFDVQRITRLAELPDILTGPGAAPDLGPEKTRPT
jgi:putative hydrolase of the HAD superfamily